MKVRNRYAFLLLLGVLFIGCNLHAQTNALYPELYATYTFNMASISPAYVPDEGRYLLGGIYKFKATDANVAIYDVYATLISGEDESSKHVFRVDISNEKEGPYINNSRGYLHYAYQLPIKKDLYTSFGAAFGFVNRFYEAPSSTGQGNLLLPDAALGIEIQYKAYRLGGTFSQLLNANGQPLEAVITLKNYFQIYAEGSQTISSEWAFKQHFLVRSLTGVNSQVVGGMGLEYNKQVQLAASYFQRRGVTFQLVMHFDNDLGLFSLSTAYNSPLISSSPIWNDSFELGMNYYLK